MIELVGFGQFELLAAAPNANVYRAVDVAHERPVAVKVLRVGGDGILRRFDRERRAMGRLAGIPNIADVYTSGTTVTGEPYIVMPLFEDSLQSVLDRDGPLGWEKACSLLGKVAVAVHSADEAGVLHIDIKPSNIFVGSQERAVSIVVQSGFR